MSLCLWVRVPLPFDQEEVEGTKDTRRGAPPHPDENPVEMVGGRGSPDACKIHLSFRQGRIRILWVSIRVLPFVLSAYRSKTFTTTSKKSYVPVARSVTPRSP